MNAPELRDIHLPDAVAWWPPAPGWWLLPLLLAAAALGLWWLRRRLRYRSIARQSLAECARIRAAHRDGQARTDTIRQVASLLRRILISYRGRAAAGASSGDDWITEVSRLAPAAGFSETQLQLLARDRYRRDFGGDVDELLDASESWIRALPGDKRHAAA